MINDGNAADKVGANGDAVNRASSDTACVAPGIPIPGARLVKPVFKPSPPSSVLITPADTAPHTSCFRRNLADSPASGDYLRIVEQVWRSVAHGIAMTDAAGIVRCANPAFVNLFGYDGEREIVGRTIRSFLEKDTELDGVMRRLRERCVCSRRIAARTRDGRVLPLNVTASPVFAVSGALDQMIFSVEDIKNILEAEKLRRQAGEEHLASVLNQTRLAAIAELGYALNDPLQTLLGLSEEDGRADYQAQLNLIIHIVRQFYGEYEARARSAASAAGAPALPAEEPSSPVPHAEAAPAPAAVPTSDGLAPCAPDTVLLADDEPMLLRLFERMLNEAFPGLRIDHAENGREAVEKFSSGHHAVIVMDVMMPEMRGEIAWNNIVELCRERQWAPPHCVFCTGYMPSDAVVAITRDANHSLLRKPVTRNAIMAVMRRHLDREL